MKRLLATLILLSALLCAHAALGESARIRTPGGKLNVRKTPEDKGRIAMSVPNHTLVDVDEIGEEWCQISYKGKSGYVRTEYLLLPAQLTGKTVYPDEGTLLLYQEPDSASLIAGAVESQESVRVLEVKDGWARVQGPDSDAWADVLGISWHLEEPKGKRAWIREQGFVAEDTALTVPGGDDVQLSAGQELLVTATQEETCLVKAGDVWGYLPISTVMLAPPEDTGTAIGAISPILAAEKAAANLRRFKTFQNGSFSAMVAPYGDTGTYQVAFLSDDDQYLYAALVEAEKGKVLFSAVYRDYHAPVRFEHLLPDGQVNTLKDGQLVRIYDSEGVLTAVYRFRQGDKSFKAYKMFI